MVSSDLKSLEIRKIEIEDVIDASNNAEIEKAIDASNSSLLDAEDQIEKAKEKIKRANLLLSKAELVHFEEIAQLE